MSAFENPERLAAIDAAMRERDARREAARILVKSARPKSDTVQVTMRIPREWLVKADALGRSMAAPGVLAVGARTVGLRVAIARGLEVMEAGK